MEFEIYWEDITPECQKRLIEFLGDNGNYDFVPIATVRRDTEEE